MLKVYNTLTHKKEKFEPLQEGKVGIYVCGLTVQNYSHLGHIRSAVSYDVIRRYLEYKGYTVTYVQNFTDINEKIVARAKEEKISPEELAEKYIDAYLEDIEQLNIKKTTHYVKATENIDAIIQMIEILLEKGYAYEINGNVYFSVEKYKDYGKLSGRSLEDMQAGARIEVVEEKRNPLDFALWKKAPEGEKEWDSPWGKGWPGWHIECSAMSMKYLGESFDIHGGGVDLIFPHHENEIAQAEASTHKPFAKYWFHNGSVNLKGEKMSKSLGNFFTTRELLNKFSGTEIRYFLLTKHYRTPIDFSIEELKSASTSLERIINTLNNLKRLLSTGKNNKGNINANIGKNIKILNDRKKDFLEAMDDDFNTARAIGVLHELIRDVNRQINRQDFLLTTGNYKLVQSVYRFMEETMEILGIKIDIENKEVNEEQIKQLLELILEIREEARSKKDWALADKIRDKLKEIGFIIKDTPQGVVWEKESDR